jgi:hypothetical protein
MLQATGLHDQQLFFTIGMGIGIMFLALSPNRVEKE